MKTSILDATDEATWSLAVQRAADVLRAGGLVAFPTETVYGLGAAVSSEPAVRRIFDAKGRPAGVPLIVHVTDLGMASRYVLGVPGVASELARRFWPGPLSLVMERAPHVSLAVTGGGQTVATRAPAHAVALELIDQIGEGIAAPSANRYNNLPPVRGAQVVRGLGGVIEGVLDAGRCPGGLESTVLDLTTSPARVLRRGAVSLEQLREVLELQDAGQGARAARVVEGEWLRVVDVEGLSARPPEGGRQGLVLREMGTPEWAAEPSVVVRRLPHDAAGYASELYDALHELRDAGCVHAWVEALPDKAEWDAMRDRLERLAASTPR